jgi:zinc protease
VDRILGVSQQEVQEAARRHVDGERLIVVVVGDLARIEEPVRARALGPVRVLSVEDVLGPKPGLSGN